MSTLHIVGGGLAGMTVAWDVTRPGSDGDPAFDVIHLYEASDRLGGKAGSNAVTDAGGKRIGWSDHGYHLFPKWYDNVIELMGEIGVDYDRVIVDGERFSQAAGDPTLRTPSSDDGSGNAELVYEPSGRLFWVALTAANLVTTGDDALRDISMHEYLDEQFPMLYEKVAPVYRGLLLKALAADLDKMSALAVAKLFRRWSSPLLRLKDPSWSSLRGSLQCKFIEPFELALNAAGVKIRMQRNLTNVRFDSKSADEWTEVESAPHAATMLVFENGEELALRPGDVVVLAMPPQRLHQVLGNAPQTMDIRMPLERLAGMSAQFSGVDIYFDEKQMTPREHFGFAGDIATTAYNITPVWDEEDLVVAEAKTVLQLVIPRPNNGTEQGIEDQVLQELAGVFEPFPALDNWHVNVNTDSPLCLANVGLYQAREAVQDSLLTRGGNIRIAGDFMDSSIGVPSMEGAVGNGRRVAAALRSEDPRAVDPDVTVSWCIRAIAAFGRILVGPPQYVWKKLPRF